MKKISLIFPIAAFLAGYFLTDLVFRVKKIPYPFELFGLAVGLGLASWTFSIIHFIGLSFSNKYERGRSSMKRWVIFILLMVAFIFSYKALFADGAEMSGGVSGKLDQVIQTQDKILAKLDEIKAELEVVKVRASNR